MAKKVAQPSREEVVKREVGHTEISPQRTYVLVVFFIASIVLVPLWQVFKEYRVSAGALHTVDVFREIPEAVRKFSGKDGSLTSQVFAANAVVLRNINDFEDELEDDSVLTQAMLSRTQSVLTGWLGAGNEEAYIGEGQWLFYRPGIDYLIGPGFLDPGFLAKRAATGSEWQKAPQPDPRRAIVQFHKQLAERNITLIVMPTPVKAMIHPEKFSRRYTGSDQPIQNPSFERLKTELEQAGILVFDPAPALVQAKLQTGRPQYLATDTHWRPEAMELAAESLAEFIRSNRLIPSRRFCGFKREAFEVSNLGDIARMLKLPADQQLYKPEKVKIHQVLTPGNEFVRSSKSSQVLLLGDSFTNIYSLESMGWGSAAGCAEQLAFYLQQPVDRLSRNDNGSFATREMLSTELAKGRDRLKGKRVVVWQFAARELAVGDWKTIDMKLGEPQATDFIIPEEGTEIVASGTIEEISPVPKPGSVPYKDHIVSLHLIDVTSADGAIKNSEAVVYMMSMRDNKLTPAARYRAGQTVTVRLKNWYDVADQLDAIKRSELSDDMLRLEDPCWGEVLKQ